MSQEGKYAVLNRTGDKMPLVGFGTARITAEDTEEVIYNAIKSGYRLIDGALAYENEPEVGKAVRRAISEGIVKREDLFIVGKLWNNFHNKDKVRPIFDMTLENYGLDYIDLYLVHWPFPSAYEDPKEHIGWFNKDKEFHLERSPIHACWAEMEKLVDAGLVRNIGVSNFNVQSLVDMATYCKYAPAALEIEHHPYLQQKRLIDWAKLQSIHIIAYASFGNTAFSKIPASTKHLPNLLSHPVLEKIAQKHNKGTGQVALAWAVQRGITVIPKSVNVPRMQSNLDIFFDLDEEDFNQIAELEARARFCDHFIDTTGHEFPIFD